LTPIVDFHHHVIPDFYWQTSNDDGNAAGVITPPRWSLDSAIAYLDEAGIDMEARALARQTNEYLADIERDRRSRHRTARPAC
jgi:6-methylsalicylate decarboxylase